MIEVLHLNIIFFFPYLFFILFGFFPYPFFIFYILYYKLVRKLLSLDCKTSYNG